MSEIMAEMVVVVFECIKDWVFYSPVSTSSSHDVISIIVGNVDISYPAKMLLLTFFIGFPVLNKIHLKISVAFIQRGIINKTITMGSPFLCCMFIIMAFLFIHPFK